MTAGTIAKAIDHPTAMIGATIETGAIATIMIVATVDDIGITTKKGSRPAIDNSVTENWFCFLRDVGADADVLFIFVGKHIQCIPI